MLEQEVEAERQGRGALAYEQQALRAKMLRLETEIILVAGRTISARLRRRAHPDLALVAASP
jgi:hypothetical protein